MLCHSKHLVFYSKESCFLKRDFVLCWLAADYTLMCLGRFYVNTSTNLNEIFSILIFHIERYNHLDDALNRTVRQRVCFKEGMI